MKLVEPANSNYACVVVKLPPLLELAGCDNIAGASLIGFQAIVSKGTPVGELGVCFPAEVQLSSDYCAVNNLYRHTELNKNPDEKGYLEENRRIRALKLRGHRSDCLFMPLSSLAYTGVDLGEFKEGMEFDRLGDYEICKKYVIKTKGVGRQQGKQEKRFVRVNPVFFPEHDDTTNWHKNKHLIPDDAYVYVTQKLHGTSWRGSRSYVLRKLTLRDRIAKRFGISVQEHEWDIVAGSRKVIKDPLESPNAQHFYSSDLWTAYLDRIAHLLPEGFVVYGELIGYTPDGAAIQSGYVYEMPEKTHELFVYRVAMVNARGVMVDLAWPQVRQFCNERGIKHVPDLWEGKHKDFDPECWVDMRFADQWYDGPVYPQALSLGANKKLVDEGVCVRWDGLRPTTLKVKSAEFLRHESSLLDKGTADIESEQSEEEDAV